MTYLPTYLPTYLSIYLSTYLPTYPPTYLTTYLPEVNLVRRTGTPIPVMIIKGLIKAISSLGMPWVNRYTYINTYIHRWIDRMEAKYDVERVDKCIVV